MIKDNFICPCCGLPKHLEFKTEEDYWRYVNAQDNSEVGDNSYKFTNFILAGEEEDRLREIQQRFNSIKEKTNWNQSFSQWFKENVVGFINETNNFYTKNILNQLYTVGQEVDIFNSNLEINSITDVDITKADLGWKEHQYNIEIIYGINQETMEVGDVTFIVNNKGNTIIKVNGEEVTPNG